MHLNFNIASSVAAIMNATRIIMVNNVMIYLLLSDSNTKLVLACIISALELPQLS